MSTKFNTPVRSYHEVKRSYYLASAGAVLPVDCQVDTDTFRATVEAAVLTAGNVEACRREVEPLLADVGDTFSRWFLLETLAGHDARFPIYGTKAEAEQAREERERKAVSA